MYCHYSFIFQFWLFTGGKTSVSAYDRCDTRAVFSEHPSRYHLPLRWCWLFTAINNFYLALDMPAFRCWYALLKHEDSFNTEEFEYCHHGEYAHFHDHHDEEEESLQATNLWWLHLILNIDESWLSNKVLICHSYFILPVSLIE